MITGGCLCGRIRYKIDEHPASVTHCHCRHCRGSSGTAFVTWAEFHPSNFKYIKGKPAFYESRPKVRREFCPHCGTQLTYTQTDNPHFIEVTVCSFDDPGCVQPEDHIWCERKLPWVKFNDGLPMYKFGRNDE